MKIKDLQKIDRPREKLEKTIEQFENRYIRTLEQGTVLCSSSLLLILY